MMAAPGVMTTAMMQPGQQQQMMMPVQPGLQANSLQNS